MKILNFFFLAAILLWGVSCKTNSEKTPEGEVIEDFTADEIPHLSDIHFEEALEAFKNSKNQDAAVHIRSGIAELKKEATAANLSSEAQDEVDKSINVLNVLADDIEAGKVQDTDRLREAFANATLNVAHDFLMTTDVFILEKPEKVNSTKMNHSFDGAIKSFEEIKGDLEKSAKKEGEKISAEAQALQKKRKELDKQINEQMKKMHKFVKTHKPDKISHFPLYELNL